MKKTIRFVLRMAITPFIVVSFGLMAIEWMIVLFPAFKLIAFVQDDPCSYRELCGEAWEMFSDPLIKTWGSPKGKEVVQ